MKIRYFKVVNSIMVIFKTHGYSTLLINVHEKIGDHRFPWGFLTCIERWLKD